ncbi:ABC transporter ATP-binding protein [Alkalicoccobacillus porphyridii]|uniref:ATP-binding cassette domain-containing protein n=1 Tax=Alkalicoccobacillus porphyridii TaxID=2597270 RepID=A0A554A032_9BACI|nr:ATP-binding cassette domain-containing protein [Alkalicoccobacillus porphyridii]TSB46996.1 ATP-binding cassette domain-containing protein [Alkalicoccobacillus porphyridii]
MVNVIKLEGVNWERDQKRIIQNIQWEVKSGEHWAILGANGSGKTSLLKLITGYEWATNGKITVFGEQFGQTSILEIRKRIGWLSASLEERHRHYNGLTCVDIIASGRHASIGIHEELSDHDVERAYMLADQMGLSKVKEAQLGTLSQGERKKTFYARALMAAPEMVIVDEPTSGLDLLAREQFLNQLHTHHQKERSPTLLYVTHYPEEIVPAVTHVLLLKNGEALAAGPKKEVLTNDYLSEAFDVPIHVAWRDERPWIQISSLENIGSK